MLSVRGLVANIHKHNIQALGEVVLGGMQPGADSLHAGLKTVMYNQRPRVEEVLAEPDTLSKVK